MKKNLPIPELFLNKTFPKQSNYKIKEHIGKGANGHVFRADNGSLKSSLAFKIIPINNLPADESDRNSYLQEATKANVLASRSVVKCYNSFFYSKDEMQYVVFVFDYVKGMNLDNYIKKHSSDIDAKFVENFLRTILELLAELEEHGFPHGDLHAGNVLVVIPETSTMRRINSVSFRVTDFGIQNFSEQPSDENDYLSVARTLERLLQCLENRDCIGKDRFVLNTLRNDFLKRHLIETDTSADPLARNPGGMLEKLDELDKKYQMVGHGLKSPKLATPFEYSSCEQIGDSHVLLKNLYSDRLLGLADIHERSNLVLTGPRGCGKTTVFRALSLDHLISVKKDRPKNVKYIGIYYRCDDLYFAFPRYTLPNRPDAFNIPMHFLIVTLLSAMLEQLLAWARKYFSDEFSETERTLTLKLWDIFELKKPNNPNASEIETLIGKLKKERQRAIKKQRLILNPEISINNYFEPRVMIDACKYIQSNLSFLKNRPFYFFIDDYSNPKITMDMQENLNRLLMYRGPGIFFKISTESPVSFARKDIDGKKFIESREYNLVNLGLRYLNSDSDKILAFLNDLFSRRFKKIKNYPAKTLEELLGSMPRNENETARVARKESDKKEHALYAGCETLAAMCSGDIHYMIRLVADMVEESGGKDSLVAQKSPRIPYKKQNNSIRSAAGQFMETIRTFPRIGNKLAEIITAFGDVAYSYLLHETSANEKGNPPHLASRIEPYEALQLKKEDQDILNELLRYSVFIEDPRGKSRRGKVVPRYYLRRYLIPHFRLTFSRRDSIQLENDEIITLLRDPKKFEKERRLKSRADAIRRHEKRSKKARYKQAEQNQKKIF